MRSFYFPGQSGKNFITLYASVPPSESLHWVIVFPAFTEEMNKCRAMVSSQARSLVDAGFSVAVPDLYGTGDSEGDFADARWSLWRSDMLQFVDRIREQGALSVSFLGIRLGCLLAADVANRLESVPDKLVFWQPVSDGKQSVNQFLRLKVAAEMMSGGQVKVSDLRQMLVGGEVLEVAGYPVAPRLVEEIDSLRLDELLPDTSRISWLEVVAGDDKPIPIGSRKKIEALIQKGHYVDESAVVGDAFWSTQEICMVPDLIARTTAIFSQSMETKPSESSGNFDFSTFSDPANERAVHFRCQESELIGILHRSEPINRRGILLVVGGPQYRVGSHRQFVLLSRALAEKGFPVLRFDYRGMGDSGGVFNGFEAINEDIASALDSFCREVPELEEVVIWGLCDAATAAAFYAPHDQRVAGLVLVNPWVRSEQGEAKAYLKHYYLERLFSPGFWRKVLYGKFNPAGSIASLWNMLRKAGGAQRPASDVAPTSGHSVKSKASLTERIYRSLSDFQGQVQIILSENDLTAAEFREETQRSKHFASLLRERRFNTLHLPEADHTFSRRRWRNKVIEQTLSWLSSW